MRRLVMAMAVAACAANGLAMPTNAEMKKAQPLVAELMAPELAKFKAAGYKEKSAAAVKVGDASSEFAKAAETEAAKFLLLKGAVSFYARGEAYDQAADTVAALQCAVKDVPPSVIAEITGKATGKISETKAPKLYAIYRQAKLQIEAADEAKELAVKLKKVKSDALQRKYAEALAVSGDWKAAYAEFAKTTNAKLKEVVAAEASGKAKNAESGEFWWTYEPAFEDAEDFFKSHAAAYYRKALDAGEITGLKKTIVEKRIAGIAVTAAPPIASSVVTAEGLKPLASPRVTNGKYDIVTGSKSPFEEKGDTLIMKLENGKTVEFVKCPAGEVELLVDYEKNETRKVKITRPYWMTKQPFGGRDVLKGILCFDGTVSAHKTELEFPRLEKFFADYTQTVSKFLPKGYVLRLPSLAEFEHAYHAGNYSKWDLYGNMCQEHSKDELRTKVNDWGIGGFWFREKILDRFSADSIELSDDSVVSRILQTQPTDDFFMWNESDTDTRSRRSVWCKKLDQTSVSNGKDPWAWTGHQHLVIGPDLVSEWKAKHGGKDTRAHKTSSAKIEAQKGRTLRYGKPLSAADGCIWKNVELSKIKSFKGRLGGAFVGGGQYRNLVEGCNVKDVGGGKKRVQFQVARQNKDVICVAAEFEQKGDDVFGRTVYARCEFKNKMFGEDFDKIEGRANQIPIAERESDKGYLLCDIEAQME